MNEGSLIQSGKALDIYQKPNSLAAAVAMADPPINLLSSTVDGKTASFGQETFAFSRPEMASDLSREITLGLQPGKVFLEPTGPNTVSLQLPRPACRSYWKLDFRSRRTRIWRAGRNRN
jgi:glycerol transport system ATP-binding protein